MFHYSIPNALRALRTARPSGLRSTLPILLAVVSAGIAPAVVSAQLVAIDDTLILSAGQSLTFEGSDLLANDAHDGGVLIEIVDWPSRGSLSVSQNGSAIDFVFDPSAPSAGPEPDNADFVGRSGFRYRIRGPFDLSQPATVHLVVTPDIVPLSGSWETPGCTDGHCPERAGCVDPLLGCGCAPGVGAELGYWHGPSTSFRLCNWDGNRELEDCLSYEVRTSTAAMPLVGDWDGNGFDDVGVFDPATGQIELYRVSAEGCASSSHCLVPFDQLPSPAGATPVAGRFEPAAESPAEDRLGRYSWTDGKFVVPVGESEEELATAPAGPHDMPIVADWLDLGYDGIGAFDPDTETFRVHQDGAELALDISGWVESYGKAPGAAFAGRKSLCGPSVVGFWDRAGEDFAIFELANSDSTPIVVKVPVDPNDGGGG